MIADKLCKCTKKGGAGALLIANERRIKARRGHMRICSHVLRV